MAFSCKLAFGLCALCALAVCVRVFLCASLQTKRGCVCDRERKRTETGAKIKMAMNINMNLTFWSMGIRVCVCLMIQELL